MKLTRTPNRPFLFITVFLLLALVAVLAVACQNQAEQNAQPEIAGATEDINAIAEARGLTPADIAAGLRRAADLGRHPSPGAQRDRRRLRRRLAVHQRQGQRPRGRH